LTATTEHPAQPGALTLESAKPARAYGFGWLKKMRETDEFSSVFRFRCSYRGACLDVLAGPNGLAISRLGMIVPKKVIRTAAGRNRVKRLLREWFRQSQADIVGLDIIARLKARGNESMLKLDFLSGLGTCKNCVLTRTSTLT
jgi:ribonuclease P protein component